MRRAAGFAVDHGRWLLAAGMGLLVAAAVSGVFSPLTAAVLAFAVLVLFVGGLMTAGIVTERLYRQDRPVERFVRDLADQGPIDAAQREELLAGESVLASPAERKSIKRHLRKTGGRP